MHSFEIDSIISNALREDIGYGDITTDSCVPEDAASEGRFVAKQAGVFCGGEVLQRVFALVDERVDVTLLVSDGEPVEQGGVIATISGPARAILTGERTALNLVQRLSGIATQTAEAVKTVGGTKARITDTRKTTPGLRVLEKYAVRTGGGANHRIGLSDGVLIKDNHIAAAGGIGAAVKAVRENIPHTLKIEVETTCLDEVRQALEAGADIIMLDNMSNGEMTEAVKIIAGRALTEASGNMGEKDLLEVAKTGVDIISVGALTHTVKAMDISLKFSL